MLKRTIPILLLFAAILVVACDDDTVSSTRRSDTDTFPNQVGATWVYQYYDSLNEFVDTVDVEVVGFGTDPHGRTAKVWQYRYRNAIDPATEAARVDTEWVIESGDTVTITRNRVPSRMTIVFPLVQGVSWTSGASYHDTSTVTMYQEQFGTYGNAWLIERDWSEPLVATELSEMWLASEVGWISRRIRYTNLMPATSQLTEEWVILSYSL